MELVERRARRSQRLFFSSQLWPRQPPTITVGVQRNVNEVDAADIAIQRHVSAPASVVATRTHPFGKNLEPAATWEFKIERRLRLNLARTRFGAVVTNDLWGRQRSADATRVASVEGNPDAFCRGVDESNGDWGILCPGR